MRFNSLNRHHDDQLRSISYSNGKAQYFSLHNNGATVNEDALVLGDFKKNCKFLLVADGMGGHPGGDDAAEAIINTFKNSYKRSNSMLCNPKLFQTLDLCNETIQSLKKDCGSTLCMCLIEKNTVQFICVGDSLGIIVDKKGQAKYATVEENSVALADEIGVTPKQAFLMNYMGFQRISYQVSPRIDFQEGDQLFLMSDGAHEFFEEGDEKDMQLFVEKLIALRQVHHTDDATCICFTK